MLMMRMIVGAWLVAAAAMGQIDRPMPEEAPAVQVPDLATAVLRALEAEYLTDEERAEMRVFHGVWREEDLNDPARRAEAALIVGEYAGEWYAGEGVPAELRAEAALRRGDLSECLEMLAGKGSLRAMRIRAEALEGLGRYDEADAAIDPVVQRLRARELSSAADLVEGVRALEIRARLRGRPGSEYQQMMELLARAYQDLDRLYWPAMLVEARLLHEKDNRQEAREAVVGTLSMNPRVADAWHIVGVMSVEMFDFRGAAGMARRIEENLRRFTGDATSVSPQACFLRARAALREEDPDRALSEVETVLGQYPRHREASALRCAAVALYYDWERLDAALAEFDELSPGSPLALYEVGRALSEQRQYEKAAEYLEAASDRQPNWAAPYIELGLLEVQSGRDLRAQAALRRATELDPFNIRARNSLAMIDELITWDTIESENFIVRYKPGVDAVMAREMIDDLEEMHRIVADTFQHDPARKTVVELMPDHQWFAVRITGMPALHTIAAATGPVIAMEVPKIGKRHSGEYDWVRVVRHEYTHTVTLSATNNRIPHWFTEAAAVQMELAPRDYVKWEMLLRAMTTNSLFDMNKINIAFVRPEKPTDRSQAYAQGHWMYEFMVDRWGSSAPLRLMELYAEGVPESEAMEEVLGLDSRAFLDEFIEWAKEDLRRHGLLPEPSIAKLRLDESLQDAERRETLKSELADFARLGGLSMAGIGTDPETEFSLAPTTPELVEFWSVMHPDHPDVLELYAIQVMKEAEGEMTPEVVEVLERYAAARPIDPMPHKRLAKHYLDQGDREAAGPHLEFLDAREQRSAAYAVELARLYASKGMLEKAEEKAERATTIAPFDANYRELAATVAIRQRAFDRAERHIRALIELEPDSPVHERRLEALERMREGRQG